LQNLDFAQNPCLRVQGRRKLAQPKAVGIIKHFVSDAEQQMNSLMQTLLASSSVEELGDCLSGLEEVKRALEQACENGAFSHREADMTLSRWLIGQ
jgi:hypothetical protein